MSTLKVPEQEEIRQLPADGGPNWNRLVFAQSPYLLQHAANPVDWYPWGEEAFRVAEEKDKPIFLSIGYATCHWCHVMAHESFEDHEVADLLNKHFIAIKVDKEERPDIDTIYMTACMAMSGHGGWPLTCMLTHDAKPFFAGTYFPKWGRHQRPGMMELIPHIAGLWKKNREGLLEGAEELTHAVRQYAGQPRAGELAPGLAKKAYASLAGNYDETYGGFGSQPKFPAPHQFLFLSHMARSHGEERARQMVDHSLMQMFQGGIYDQVGFGYHRYSTDREWLLPHFEKMLYDQAMLTMANLEGYRDTGNPALAQAARETLTYVLRDMTHEEGAFFSAEDADSEGEEGKFYVWTRKEWMSVIGKENGSELASIFNINKEGNFYEEATGRKTGTNIPHRIHSWQQLRQSQSRSSIPLETCWENVRPKLLAQREKRVRPLRDDKILTDWNGLMIAAFAKAGRLLEDDRYTHQAEKAAAFIFNHLTQADGRLFKRMRQGHAGLPGLLDDYAFMVWGLLELYQSSLEFTYLRQAKSLLDKANTLFWDDLNGGYFLTPHHGERLITRTKSIHDGAIPSGNSVMIANLVHLGQLLGLSGLIEMAETCLKAFGADLAKGPGNATYAIMALDMLENPAALAVVAGKRNGASTAKMLDLLRKTPQKQLPLILLKTPEIEQELHALSPLSQDKAAGDEDCRVYLCHSFHCKKPTSDPVALAAQLAELDR